MINKALLKELREIIKEEYKVELSQAALAEVADTLVGFFELLAKIESVTKREQV